MFLCTTLKLTSTARLVAGDLSGHATGQAPGQATGQATGHVTGKVSAHVTGRTQASHVDAAAVLA